MAAPTPDSRKAASPDGPAGGGEPAESPEAAAAAQATPVVQPLPLTPAPAARLILYSRPWCHLCEEMLAAIEPVAAASGLGVQVIDIDEDPALVARYDELVPVLVCDGVELARYRLDPAQLSQLRAALDGPVLGGEARLPGQNAR